MQNVGAFVNALTPGEIGLRVGAALLMGALVGLERERKQRPAGFRTMILVSLGSAAFMMIGAEIVGSTGQTSTGQAEMSRVIQGLIGGIGFLGAGAVIQNKKAVRGMTTAAAIWVTAAIGAACGLGFYSLAAIVSTATLFTLIVLEIVEERYFPDTTDDDGGNGHGKGKGKANANADAADGAADRAGDAGGQAGKNAGI